MHGTEILYKESTKDSRVCHVWISPFYWAVLESHAPLRGQYVPDLKQLSIIKILKQFFSSTQENSIVMYKYVCN